MNYSGVFQTNQTFLSNEEAALGRAKAKQLQLEHPFYDKLFQPLFKEACSRVKANLNQLPVNN